MTVSGMLCPFALVELLPESATQSHITPRVVILHSTAGYGSPRPTFVAGNLESHFWVASDGAIHQFMDTNTRADANRNANGFAVSIETESSPAATEPWSPAQIASIEKLIDWLCTVHPDIPRRLCDRWDGAGIGWHIQFGTPGPWTPVAKSCPGPARIAQVPGIIAAVAAMHGTPPPTTGDLTVADVQQILNAIEMVHQDLTKHIDEVKAGVLVAISEGRQQAAADAAADAHKP